jgi:vacuolar-type H+-ATPase catalytic subunit A/Vma1
MSIYKQALRQNLRFAYKGTRSVEELWGLSVEELDAIYQDLISQREVKSRASLLVAKSTESTALDLQIEIVKDIVETLLQEKSDRAYAADKAAKRQRILQAIAKKEDTAIDEIPLEELQKMITNL